VKRHNAVVFWTTFVIAYPIIWLCNNKLAQRMFKFALWWALIVALVIVSAIVAEWIVSVRDFYTLINIIKE
jgi:hypothetical protein